jgi:hypothetical protein
MLMTRELQLVDVATGEVVMRVDVSLRDDDEVDKAREALATNAGPGREVRGVD